MRYKKVPTAEKLASKNTKLKSRGKKELEQSRAAQEKSPEVWATVEALADKITRLDALMSLPDSMKDMNNFAKMARCLREMQNHYFSMMPTKKEKNEAADKLAEILKG